MSLPAWITLRNVSTFQRGLYSSSISAAPARFFTTRSGCNAHLTLTLIFFAVAFVAIMVVRSPDSITRASTRPGKTLSPSGTLWTPRWTHLRYLSPSRTICPYILLMSSRRNTTTANGHGYNGVQFIPIYYCHNRAVEYGSLPHTRSSCALGLIMYPYHLINTTHEKG